MCIEEQQSGNGVMYFLYSLAGLAGITLIVGLFLVFPFYNRYQTRMNAQNEVAVNEIKIKQQEQLIQVEKQKAEIRIVEAGGIAESQKIIAASLTDGYLQYLAVEAQKTMASSPNHTTIYIPSGNNGIPLVNTVGK